MLNSLNAGVSGLQQFQNQIDIQQEHQDLHQEFVQIICYPQMFRKR